MTRKVTVVTGHEQAGDRPAIIVSPGAYNQKQVWL